MGCEEGNPGEERRRIEEYPEVDCGPGTREEDLPGY